MSTSHPIQAIKQALITKQPILWIFLVSTIMFTSGVGYTASPVTHNAMPSFHLAIVAMHHAAIYGQEGDVAEVSRFATEAFFSAHEALLRIADEPTYKGEAKTLLKESIKSLQKVIAIANTGGTADLIQAHVILALDYAETAKTWYELQS
tara:strand:+ start:2446 stop:2895 length:450 start_codon:yes stop_codon:yes gene_type:complete